MRRTDSLGRWILAVALVAFPLRAIASPESPAPPRPYHEAYAAPPRLALTPGLTGPEFTALLDRLDDAGLIVPLAMPGHGLVVLDKGAVRVALRREGAVTRVLDGPALGPDPRARGTDPAEAGLYMWWNDGFEDPAVLRARREVEYPPDPNLDRSAPIQICAGATTLEEALLERGYSSLARCSGSDEQARVHFATGRFVVNVILPESSIGSGWDPVQKAKVYSELARAMNWWYLQASRAGGIATFIVRDYGTVTVDSSPAELGMAGEYVYIGECMDQILGSGTDCPYQHLDELNTANRDAEGANWAYTQFVLNASEFTGSPGVLAYAYLGGPHTVALRGNGSLGPDALDQVVAHEMGHIFQARDEYSDGCGGCLPRAGYLNALNGNCENCGMSNIDCIMRGGSTYDDADRENMETRITPCWYTRGQVGLWDSPPSNGILDVMETVPETEMWTTLPDTLDGSRNVQILGRAWDLPYAFAPPHAFSDPVTINTIFSVQYSVDRTTWRTGHAVDNFFTDVEEEWEIRLPSLGGGPHRLEVRGVNSVGAFDPVPASLEFFVFDVMLREEVQVSRNGSAITLVWTIDGLDFGSTYFIWRRDLNGERADRSLRATLPSDHTSFQTFVWWDDHAVPGMDYIYEVEVDIPGKGLKSLGTVRETAVLADPTPGSFVRVAPNPARERVLFTVNVPRGPAANVPDGPGEPPPGQISAGRATTGGPASRDGPTGGTGGFGYEPRWRDVRMSVYDVSGRLVRNLGVSRQLELTRFNQGWDGRDRAGALVPPGVYFLRTSLEYVDDLQKIVIVR